jgi:thiamine pyrophosphokinase
MTASASHFINNFSTQSQSSAVVFLGGELQNEALARELAVTSKLIVCADSGAGHARKLGLIPQTLKHFEDKNCKIVRISDQESNDFAKALAYLSEQFQNRQSTKELEDFGSVFVLGMTGGRTDHTLANFSVMLRYTDRFDSIVAFEPGAEHRFLTTAKNSCRTECEIGTTISLTPFGEANGIVTENLQYPLSNETLRLGIREGISNVSTGSPVTISIESGALLVTVLDHQ